MVPNPNSSVGPKYGRCPIPKTHRRLAEAHLLWHQALDRYHDPEAFRANLNATIEALRNVTFVLQNEKSRFGDFDSWYGPWQARLKADMAARWLHDARTIVVHQGELDSHSRAEVRLLTWRDEVIARLEVPSEIPSSLILKNLHLLNLLSKSQVTSEELKNGVIAIERRWSTISLGNSEILEALAQVYGTLSDLVLDAHVHLGQCECIPTTDVHSDFRSTYHRTGTLECMASGLDLRTQTFKVATGDEISYTQVLVSPSVQPREAILRYGLDEDDKLAPWEELDPARFAKRVLHSAKRILRRDGTHVRMMFIRDGHGVWHLLPLEAEDKAEQHLLMRIVADFVESKGCDAIVEVAEAWTTLAKPPTELVSNETQPDKARGETLFVMVATREGFIRTYITPFRRGPFGGIKLSETHESEGMWLPYLQPVMSVWHRQGYTLLEDGKIMRRVWDPDPLDECFCGGPKRFAECCRQRIPLNPSVEDGEVKKAITAGEFSRAEELSRAALAQYVIWVKQHTAGMMNVAPEAYKMFVDIDVLALEGHVLTLRAALEANGHGEEYVQHLRQLAFRIGVPRLSIRLIALAGRWFMNEGRAEEAILALDGLGNLDKVDDTLALMIAAHIYDYPIGRVDQLLQKAISSAASEDEKWAAQLELAEHSLVTGRKEMAEELLDTVIAESAKSGQRQDGIPQALVLRWRITKDAHDLGAALEAVQRGGDTDCQIYGGLLVDEGEYSEAEDLLSGQIEKGNSTAKLLIVHARVRAGNTDSARDLLFSIPVAQLPERLKHAYAVACSLVALSGKDEVVRTMAIRAIQALPPCAQENDKGLRTLMQALNDDNSAA